MPVVSQQLSSPWYSARRFTRRVSGKLHSRRQKRRSRSVHHYLRPRHLNRHKRLSPTQSWRKKKRSRHRFRKSRLATNRESGRSRRYRKNGNSRVQPNATGNHDLSRTKCRKKLRSRHSRKLEGKELRLEAN